MTKNILAIIPARGGSKGIIRKNMCFIDGIPLISNTIRTAFQSTKITRVIVSTDDDEIREESIRNHAEVVQRPDEISGDSASSESALIHVLTFLKEKEGYQPDLTVFLQCTSPLTRPEDIDGCINELIQEDADSAFAAVEFHYFIWEIDGSGSAFGINHDQRKRLLRQEKKKQYLEAGSVYVMRTELFLEKQHRFVGKTVIYPIPKQHCFEIDEPIDLQIAEVLYQKYLK